MLVLATAVACSASDLPDAPDPPHRISGTLAPIQFSPPPDQQDNQPLPSAPHANGRLARCAAGYLELVSWPNSGRTVYGAFPYDFALGGLQAPVSNSRATLAIDGGTAQTLTPYLNAADGTLFFYGYPKVSAGSHTVSVTATINGVQYTGTFNL